MKKDMTCKNCICYNCESNDPDKEGIEPCSHCEYCIKGEEFVSLDADLKCPSREERNDG